MLRIVGIVCLAYWLCGCHNKEDDSRPPDVPGSLSTALSLTLGGHAIFWEDATSVEVCLTPDGLCVPADYRVDECFQYEDLKIFVNDVELPQEWPGGWSPHQAFEPLPSGGNGYGCTYPFFNAEDFVGPVGASSTELTVRLGNEEVRVVVSHWLTRRALRATGPMVKGTTVQIDVEPMVSSSIQTGADGQTGSLPTATFVYDDSTGELPYDFQFGEISPGAWGATGFELSIPNDAPAGPGRLELGEFFKKLETPECPFMECNVIVNRISSEDGLSIEEP